MKVRPSDDVIVVISTLIFLLFLKFNQFVAVILTRSKSLPYFLNVLNRKKNFASQPLHGCLLFLSLRKNCFRSRHVHKLKLVLHNAIASRLFELRSSVVSVLRSLIASREST